MSLRTLQRGKDKPYLTEFQKQAARRVGDLSRIYRDQYPNGLPHNDIGVKYAKYMCRTKAFLPGNQGEQWLDRYAAWMDAEIRDSILRLGPHWYSKRSLGNHLEIDNEDRERLRCWTVEAYDITKEDREVINRDKNKQSHERQRRKAGAKPRAQSLERIQPWKSLGMSRPTFYRLPKEVRDRLVADLSHGSSETESSRPTLVYNGSIKQSNDVEKPACNVFCHYNGTVIELWASLPLNVPVFNRTDYMTFIDSTQHYLNFEISLCLGVAH